MVLFTPRASYRPQTGRPTPQKWSEKASSDRCSLGPSDRLSPRDKMSMTSDSSTNQMVFHGVSSDVHSFRISHWDLWKEKFV